LPEEVTEPTEGARVVRPAQGAASRLWEGEVSWLAVVNILLRRRRIIVLVALAVVIVTVLPEYPTKREYTASATFLPRGQQSGMMSRLASQLGFGGAGGEGAASPQFYIDLLRSRSVLGPVVESPLQFRTDSGPTVRTLIDVYGLRRAPPASARRSATGRLAGQIKASVSPKTGVITLNVTAPYPSLAEAVGTKLLEELGRFNREIRQSQASIERRFIELQLVEASAELRSAENRLLAFLQENRSFGAPRLAVDRDRIRRELEMHQQVYTGLRQALVQARRDEVHDTPAITVIEKPEAAPRPNPTDISRKAVLAIIVGLLLGAFLALAYEYLSASKRREIDKYEEFRSLREEALTDLSRPFTPLRRLVRRAGTPG
jgi:uncharacterized protein involved in exopolysaccharide biosynthesis